MEMEQEQVFKIYLCGANRPIKPGVSRVEWWLGCSGSDHARQKLISFYNEAGEHCHARLPENRTTGPCDGSCKKRNPSGAEKGFF